MVMLVVMSVSISIDNATHLLLRELVDKIKKEHPELKVKNETVILLALKQYKGSYFGSH